MQDTPDSVKTFMSALDTVTNRFDDETVAATAAAMTRNHRSLQQRTMTLFVQFVTLLAKDYDAGRYDARNECSCKLAKKMTDAIKDDLYIPDGGVPQLPFI